MLRCWDEMSRRMHTGWVGGARESRVAPHHHHHRHHCSLVLKLTQCALLHHLSPCQGDYLHHCNIPQGSVLICAQQGGPVQLGIILRGGDLNWVASSRHQFEEMGSGWLKLVEAHLQNGTTPKIALHPFVSDFVQTSEEQTFNFHFKTNTEGNESMYAFDGFLSKPGCTSYRLLYFSVEISPPMYIYIISYFMIFL